MPNMHRHIVKTMSDIIQTMSDIIQTMSDIFQTMSDIVFWSKRPSENGI